jgi:acetyl esterase
MTNEKRPKNILFLYYFRDKNMEKLNIIICPIKKFNMSIFKYSLVLLIVLISFFSYFIFVKDPEVHPISKILHYFITILNYRQGLYTENFKREYARTTKFANSGFANSYPNITVEEFLVASKDGHHIPVEFLIPKQFDPSKGVIIQIHGGGFVLGGSSIYSPQLTAGGQMVISIYYRLAPEHPFPAGPDDCFEVFKWIYSRQHEFLKDIDLSKLTVVGDSAGGNLAAVLSYRVRDDDSFKHKISKQVLIYPVVYFNKMSTESNQKYGYVLTKAKMDWFIDQYIQDKKYLEHPHASILHNKNHKNLPETMIILAKYDPLNNEGMVYSKVLEENGVKVFTKEYRIIHATFGIVYMEEENQAMIDTLKFISQ